MALWGCTGLNGLHHPWPSHSSQCLVTFIAMVSMSLYCSRVIAEVICCSQCCMLVMSKMMRMQWWWKALSRLRCLHDGVQHSDLYSSMDDIQASYTFRLVLVAMFLSLKTAWCRTPKPWMHLQCAGQMQSQHQSTICMSLPESQSTAPSQATT